MKLRKNLSIIIIVFYFFSLPLLISEVNAHSLFNSAEQFHGGYRVQVATLPEFPNIGETSQLLFRITDADFNEVERFTMGVEIFFNDELVDSIPIKSHEDSHFFTEYVFERPGNHIFRVSLYDMPDTQGVLSYTFNMSTQSPFGYIFFVSISIGAAIFTIVIGYIYLPRILKFRSKS